MLSYKSYVICTTPRSGSTLLCRLLLATEQAGAPDSHFHTPSLARWLEFYGVSRGEYASDRAALAAVFEAALAHGRGASDVFGLRLQRGSFEYLMQQLAVLYPEGDGDVGRIEAAFGPTLFLHLTREDKLEQAISRVKAEQTGLWHRAADGAELERSSEPQEPVYDGDAIARHIAELTALDAAWGQWFAREGVQPLRVAYGALAGDPLGVLKQVVGRLGLDPAIADAVDVPTAKLSDQVSRDWAARFRAERPA